MTVLATSPEIVVPQIHPEVAIAHANMELGNVDYRFVVPPVAITAPRERIRAAIPDLEEAFVIVPEAKTHLVNVDKEDARISRLDELYMESEVVCDALVTCRRNVGLVLNTADCVALALADPKRDILAVIHLGWRGIIGRLLESSLHYLEAEYDLRTGDSVAYLGPSIQQGSYDMHTLPDQMTKPAWEPHMMQKDGKFYPDFPGFVIETLQKFGVQPENIHEDKTDVGAPDSKHFSFTRHRNEGVPDGRNAFIASLI